MKVDIETDTNLQNLVRHVRERLLANNPVQAYICIGDLENYLHGKNMDGSLINKNLCTSSPSGYCQYERDDVCPDACIYCCWPKKN